MPQPNVSAVDYIKGFTWVPTAWLENEDKYAYVNPEIVDEQKLRDQDFIRKQLHNFLSQLVDLYKHLLEEHGLKALQIKPQNILLSTRGQLKVYHLVANEAPKARVKEFIGPEVGSSKKKPAVEDLLDLGQLVFFLCTQEPLLPNIDDTDYDTMKQETIEWLEELSNLRAGKKQPRKYLRSISKFNLLPNYIQDIIVKCIDFENHNFINWSYF